MNFSIPPWRKAPKPTPSLTEQLAAAMRGPVKRVLFLEDDRLWRDLVGAVAQDYEIELVEASTSGDAMKALEEGAPFDAAVLDVGVTNGDGIELYRWLRRAHPRLNVIFLTGARVEEVADRIHAVGCAPVYFKQAVMTVSFISDFIEKLGARRRIHA